MLREVLTQVNKMTCLEVELPEGELEKRRISFYEKMDFAIIHIHILSHQLLREETQFHFVL